jgi:hypothetical protein
MIQTLTIQEKIIFIGGSSVLMLYIPYLIFYGIKVMDGGRDYPGLKIILIAFHRILLSLFIWLCLEGVVYSAGLGIFWRMWWTGVGVAVFSESFEGGVSGLIAASLGLSLVFYVCISLFRIGLQ